MARIEMTVTATDEAPEQSTASRARFKLQFMMLMLSTGRDNEAEQALRQALELIDELIEAGQ